MFMLERKSDSSLMLKFVFFVKAKVALNVVGLTLAKGFLIWEGLDVKKRGKFVEKGFYFKFLFCFQFEELN